jgi:hypothetical protein
MFEKAQLSVGDWLLFYLIMAVPVVNIIMFFVIIAGTNTNPTLKSYLISGLVLGAISVVLFFTIFASFLSEFAYYFL